MPSLVHRPRLLDLHTRHMALVGKLTSDLEAAVLDTEWYAGLQNSVDVFSACGPMHERAGLTPTQRLTTSFVPLVQQVRGGRKTSVGCVKCVPLLGTGMTLLARTLALPWLHVRSKRSMSARCRRSSTLRRTRRSARGAI